VPGAWSYTIHTWQSPDGLPEETVQSFAQTPDGYLWVGTSGGLLRFDGARFNLFASENTPAFTENSVFCLKATRDGRLLIGTDGGGLIELRNGVFRSLPDENGQTAGFIRAIEQDHTGLIWVATDDGLFWSKNGRMEHADKPLNLPAFNVHAVLEDHTGRIWVGGSRLYSVKDGQVHEYSLPGNDSRNKVKSFVETPDGSIWVGTVAGLHRMLPGRNRFEPVAGVLGTVRSLRALPSGELWAGTIGEGIFRISDGHVTRLTAPSLLVSNTVLSIFGDNDASIWIGTQAGMMRLSDTPVQVHALPGAADSDFGTVSLDTDGSLWAASNQLVHIQGGRATPFQFPTLKDVRVRNVLRSRDGSVWVGTDGSGVYHFSPSGIKHFTTREGLVNNFVRCFLEAKDGSLWIGTDSGISKLDRGGIHNYTDQNGLAYNSIRSLLEERSGTVWIGTEHGLSKFRNGMFARDAPTAALANEKVWALHQDSDGGIWIGTRTHGIYRFLDGQLTHYTAANGLASDSIYSILEDKSEHFWVSGPSGVTLLNRHEMDARALDPSQPLSLHVFLANEGGKPTQFQGGTQPSATLDRSGEAWFPTNQGLWSIRPEELSRPFVSRLDIDSVTVDGQKVAPSANIHLSAGAARLEIAYEPILLRAQDGLRFRFKLGGFDQTWTYATNSQQRLATYTNLPAGHYSFVVEAWEIDQPKRTVSATLGIDKKQYLYRTPPFIGICLLAAIGVSVLIYQMRMRQINGRFKAVLGERTRLAREMHDTLIQGCVSISALLEAASHEVEDQESRSHLIEYASTQIRATVDEARQAVWNLRGDDGSSIDLETGIRRITERIGREHGVGVTFRQQGKPFVVGQQAAHELMMVVREAVFNAILHGHSQNIETNLTYADESVSLAVSDDGSGFDVIEVVPETHFGLRGMQERIHRFGGKFEIDSAPRRGVCVRVKIPRAQVAQ
jgi:ligand-binding sensor domain-containing protein/signal transduction histidine kinase